METHPSLAAALAAFQAEMPTVAKAKTATVPTKAGGQYRYTYADLADVTQAAMPGLARHGLSFTSRPSRTETGAYELVGVLRHVSGERDEGALPIAGHTAQEIGSSLTYGRRYLLGCMTGIVTDDDDDGALAQSSAAQRKPRAAAPQDRPSTPQDRPSGQDPITPDQTTALHAAFNAAGVTERDTRLAYCRQLIGRDIGTSKDLTRAEASRVIDALHADTEQK